MLHAALHLSDERSDFAQLFLLFPLFTLLEASLNFGQKIVVQVILIGWFQEYLIISLSGLCAGETSGALGKHKVFPLKPHQRS